VAKVTMPQLGESVAEGTIGKWLKQPGDSVAKDEPLLEVITDKVNAEVPSPFEGILRKILVEEGQTVPYAAEIAEIEEASSAAGAQATPRGAGTAAEKAAPVAPAVATAPAATPAAPSTAEAVATAATPAPAEPAPLVPVMAVGDQQPLVRHELLNPGDQPRVGDLPQSVYGLVLVNDLEWRAGLSDGVQDAVDLAERVRVEHEELAGVRAGVAEQLEAVYFGA